MAQIIALMNFFPHGAAITKNLPEHERFVAKFSRIGVKAKTAISIGGEVPHLGRPQQ
jgi:hypothetical protein